MQPTTVSVVLVNFRGADDTIAAIGGLTAIDWPADALEIVVVDNDSGGDDLVRIREAAPHAVVVASPSNVGFAGGCNLGVRRSHGEIIAFLNNDATPDAAWIRAAVAAFDDEDVAAVASRVLDWDGRLVDFVDAGLTWFGGGYKPFVGEPAERLGTTEKDVLFATGAAMFVRRSAFDAVGGFDERYFMFYEDVDLGWRLNLRGCRVRYVPGSVARHRHHASAGRYGAFRERYMLDRNALMTIYKNYETAALHEVLPAALGLTVRRGVAAGGLDSSSFDYRRALDDAGDREQVSRDALASIYAVDQFVAALPDLVVDRERIQASRRRTDRELWSLFGRVDAVDASDENYAAGYAAVVDGFSVGEPTTPRLLIVTGDPIGARMAGPAIRAWNLANSLRAHAEVTVVTMGALEPIESPFRVLHVRAGDERRMAELEAWADAILFQGHALAAFDVLRDSEKLIIADVYDPMHLEQLEQGRSLPTAAWDIAVADATRVLNEQLERADFIVCASERQRSFYLGQLAALGRINPANYHGDADLRGLIDVVPFGIGAEDPEHRRAVLKGVHPGISTDDKLLIWAGGLYEWFDPETLIRAVARLAQRRPEVRLYFLGTKHPNPGVPEMPVVARARALAADLDALDRSVFFNDSWVPFEDRGDYLTEADAGVSTHFVHVETTFSFRTRILDYLWAGLPMVVTEGDSFAALVGDEELGVVVPERDVDALAAALEHVLFDEEFARRSASNVAQVRERFRWDRVVAPLVGFLDDPRPAADRAERRVAVGLSTPRPRRPRSRLRRDLALVRHYLVAGGPRVVLRKAMNRLRRR